MGGELGGSLPLPTVGGWLPPPLWGRVGRGVLCAHQLANTPLPPPPRPPRAPPPAPPPPAALRAATPPTSKWVVPVWALLYFGPTAETPELGWGEVSER